MKRRKRLSTLTRPSNIAPFKLGTFVIDKSADSCTKRHLTKILKDFRFFQEFLTTVCNEVIFAKVH